MHGSVELRSGRRGRVDSDTRSTIMPCLKRKCIIYILPGWMPGVFRGRICLIIMTISAKT